jgi:hypothetical protein
MTWLETRNLCCALERPVTLRGRFQRCPTHKRREHISKEVERFRFAFSPRFSICGCKTTELDQSCLVRVQLQTEPTQTFLPFLEETLCVGAVLKSQHSIVSVSNDDYVSRRMMSPPALDP